MVVTEMVQPMYSIRQWSKRHTKCITLTTILTMVDYQSFPFLVPRDPHKTFATRKQCDS